MSGPRHNLFSFRSDHIRWPRGGVGVCLMALALGGCSVDVAALKPDFNKVKETIAPRDLNVFQRRQPMSYLPVKAEDLVGADGRCAFDPAPAPSAVLNFTAGPQAPEAATEPNKPPQPESQAQQPVVRGIALGMTECEVVHAAGYTDRVEIGTNERGQRATVLTYPSGPRPGIYRFTGGRLVSIERGSEPPPAPKPAKPAKAKKKASG